MYFEALDDAIAVHLNKTGKTKAEFAAEIGMSTNSLRWKRNGENGKEWDLSEAALVCDAIGADLADIMARQRDEYGWPPPEAAGDAARARRDSPEGSTDL